MKILSIGNFTTGWDGSICDEEHIAQGLEYMGHHVTRWQRGEPVPSRHEGYDFALIAQWDGYGSELFKMIKVYCAGPIVYWAFDYQAEGQEWHERLIDMADLYLSKRIADSKYDNWRWLSQDFAPMFLHEYTGYVEKDIDILFTGSYLPWATERIETLRAVDKMFNLTIHSFTPDAWINEGFKDVHGPVMDADLPKLIARANLNLSIDHTIEAGYWSDRNAQIMVCGGNVLSRYVPMAEATFKDHIHYFYNVDDCLAKIEQGVAHSADSYYYAQSNLKVVNRVQDLLTIVGSIL
jgi:hypothetical protein